MISNVVCFLAGFVVAVVIWGAINYSQHRPQDYTENWPEWEREASASSDMDWMQNAYGRQLNGYTLYAPADASNASIHLNSPAPGGLPGVMFTDGDADGKVESILLADAANRTFIFADDDGNGEFDSFEYDTDSLSLNTVSFRDDNLDGQFDVRNGPGRVFAVFLESAWREVTLENKQHFVDIDGERTHIEIRPHVRIIGGDSNQPADD